MNDKLPDLISPASMPALTAVKRLNELANGECIGDEGKDCVEVYGKECIVCIAREAVNEIGMASRDALANIRDWKATSCP